MTDVKDVTGAGDALAAGTLFSLMEAHDLDRAVQCGMEAARAILEVEGAWRRDLKQRLGKTQGAPI